MEGPRNIAAGAIGSRIAGRLTADLILRSPQYMSCVGEYQIDLRGEHTKIQQAKYHFHTIVGLLTYSDDVQQTKWLPSRIWVPLR